MSVGCLGYRITRKGCKIYVYSYSDKKTYSFTDADYGVNSVILSDLNGHTLEIHEDELQSPLLPCFKDFFELFQCECANGVAAEEPVDPNEPTKELEEIIWVQDPDDKKNNIPLYVFSNPNCIASDIEGNNIVDLNNYNMGTVIGMPLPQDLASKTKRKTFEYCPDGGLTGTLQDLLDEAIARGLLLPDGTVPTGATKIRILAEYAGQQVNGKKTTATGITVTDGAEPFSLDGGQDYCTDEPTVDEDCDGFLGLCVDLTTPVVFPAGAGAVIEVIGAPCDADDTDIAVQ